MNDSMLKIENLSKIYAKSDVKAVDCLNLNIKPGEIFGFIGPNGAGKTTTIKMITGILDYNEGNIEVCGYDLKKQANLAKKSIGYVSDSHIMYDKLSGREYIEFLANIYGVDQKIRDERANKLLELFNLNKEYNDPITTYSHGMKQKINIIGALIHDPKLWILDEPMTGLDPTSAYQLKTLMKEHCEKGNSVFFSTHVLDVAEKLCDRVGIIIKGKLVLEGSLDDIKQASQDKSLEEVFLNIANEVNTNKKADSSVILEKENKSE